MSTKQIIRRKNSEWLEYLSVKNYNLAMDNVKSQGSENRLEWDCSNGIAAITLLFDFTKSKEGYQFWLDLVCSTFGE